MTLPFQILSHPKSTEMQIQNLNHNLTSVFDKYWIIFFFLWDIQKTQYSAIQYITAHLELPVLSLTDYAIHRPNSSEKESVPCVCLLYECGVYSDWQVWTNWTAMETAIDERNKNIKGTKYWWLKTEKKI